MDRRQRKTRESIFRAFGELLQHRRYENITVGDIIAKADIGRSTFYAHCETKDDLLKAICSNIFDHIFKGDDCDYHAKNETLEEKLAHILWHLKDHKNDILGLLSCESGGLFMGHIRSYLDELFALHLQDFTKPVPDDFLKNHLTGSFCEVIHWCAAKGMEISPEKTANNFMQLIS
jgi:AcrR family transcriptional regulator